MNGVPVCGSPRRQRCNRGGGAAGRSPPTRRTETHASEEHEAGGSPTAEHNPTRRDARVPTAAATHTRSDLRSPVSVVGRDHPPHGGLKRRIGRPIDQRNEAKDQFLSAADRRDSELPTSRAVLRLRSDDLDTCTYAL